MPVDPSKPVALIWKQIKDVQKFATAAGTPFSAQQIITAAETLILGTNKYQDAYRMWLTTPSVNRTYVNLKTNFDEEYQLQNTLNTTGYDAGYHQMNNVNETDQPTIKDTVQNFAVTNEVNSKAFATLANTNQDLNAFKPCQM